MHGSIWNRNFSQEEFLKQPFFLQKTVSSVSLFTGSNPCPPPQFALTMQNIPQLNVHDLMFANPEQHLNLGVLGSPPVTPVKVNHLDQLPTRTVDHYCFGFPIDFLGEPSSFESANLKSAFKCHSG